MLKHPAGTAARRFTRRTVATFAAAAAALGIGLTVAPTEDAHAVPGGFNVSGSRIVDGNGNTFVMRGANHGHAWYTGQTRVWADLKAAGANTIRVVLTGGRYGYSAASDVTAVINRCKQHKLVCVLENHDTTGYGDQSGAYTLDQAANYWVGVKAALQGQERYAIVNIGNEPLGNNRASEWTSATTSAIRKLRSAGIRNQIVVDAPNWGQDHQGIMRDNAASVLGADPDRNVVFSVHMYGVYGSGTTVRNYIDSFTGRGLPLIIGEFGHDHSDGQVDENTIMSHAQYRGVGWLAWSWSGNGGGVEYLDMVNGFNPSSRTWWGNRVITGTNGLSSTSRQASIY
ncbi:cellulase family glycosylhydrolase [Kineococcus sp. NUM-3379]